MKSKRERYREILAVLAHHGIGTAGDHLIKHEAGDHARAEHLRRACEDLGTVSIKLGQALSTRADLLPDVYRMELRKLQDDVPPLPTAAIVDVIREDLEGPLDLLFASFDPQPLGSASIAQVHAARLFDGRDVAVKVRKPGVDELVRIDLEILVGLVDGWSPRFPVLEQFDARGLVREFADDLRAELDFVHEAANETMFRNHFQTNSGINIPAIVDEYSKGRVLTEERVRGRKASEVADLPGPRRALIARRLVQFMLEPAFARGVFHADLHPGNLLVQADDSLTIIDFGKVGRLTPIQRRRVADLFVAMDGSDAQRITDRLIDLTAPSQPIDRALFVTEIDRMLALYVNVSLEKVRVGDALGELLQLGRHYRLRLPGNLVQFFKALAMCEGMLLAIEPDASFSDFLRPMAGTLIFEGFAGQNGVGLLRDSALDAVELSLELPRRIDRVLGEIERGNLRVWTRVEDIEPLVNRLERAPARTNAAMLVAACIVGLALIIPISHPPGWEAWNDMVFWIAVVAVVAGSVATVWRLLK